MAEFRDSVIFQIEIQDSQALKETAKLEKQLLSLRKERTDLNKAIKEGNGATDEQAKELAKLNIEIQGTSKALRQSRKETTAVAGSLNDQRAQLSRLLREYDNFDNTVDNATDELTKLKAEINDLTAEIKAQEEGTDRFQRNVGNYKNAVVGAFDQVGISLTQFASGPLAAAFAAEKIIEATQAAIQYAEELREITVLTQQLTGETGPALDNIIAKTQTISEIYDKDYREALVAINAVSKQFGINQSEALDIVQTGFAAGADASEEFLDILREYSPQLKAIGLDASSAVSIITQQVRSGAFSDKGIDALKEAGERLQLMPKATEEALDAIGISSNKIQQSIQSGSTSVFEVIQSVSERLGELPPQSQKVGTAIEQVFGTPGLDLGLPLLLELKDINLELDEVIDQSGIFAKQQLELVKSTNLLNATQNRFFNASEGGFGRIINDIKIFVNNFKAGILFSIVQATNGFIDFTNAGINGFARIRGAIFTVGSAFEFLGNDFQRVGTLAKTLFTDIGNLPEVATRLLEQRSSEFSKLGETYGSNIAESLEQAASSRLQRVNFFGVSGSTNAAPAPRQTGGSSGGSSSGSSNTSRALPSIAPILSDPKVLEERLNLERDQIKAHLEKINELRAQEIEQFKLGEEEKQRLSEQTQQDILEGIVDTSLTATNSLAQLAGSVASLADGIAKNAKEGSEAERQAQAVRKKAATAAVVFSSATAIADAIKTAQALSGQFPPFSIPIGIAYGAAQVASIVANRVAQIKEIQKFREGGRVLGPSHEQGGVNINAEGGEYVIRKSRVNSVTLPMLEAFNQGKIPVFRTGGLVPGGNTVPSGIAGSTERLEIAFTRALAKMKPSVVNVRDIISEVDNVVEVEKQAVI